MGIMKLLGTSFSTILNGGNPTADRTVTFPDASGTAILDTTIGGRALTLMTAQNSTSGTSIDFTGIPSWAKRITVMFNGVSTNGTSHLIAQLGDSEGVETTGYVSCSQVASTPYYSTVGALVSANMVSANNNAGIARLQLISGNTWVLDAIMTPHQLNSGVFGSGVKTLSATLDRIRITTVNGTDTFDAGSINVMYEG